MRTLRVGAWLSLVVFVNLVFATAAHAQAAPPAPPPAPPGMPPPPPPPYDAAAPQLQQPMAAPTGPVVRLNANNPAARLQMMTLRWTDVCRTPCGVPVDPNGVYRVGGGTIRPSDEFRMPRPSGLVDIQASTGSTIKHWVGFGMILGGLGAMAGGALVLAGGSSTTTDAFGNTTVSDTYKAVGITYLVIGAIVAAVGIPLAASSTSVEVR